jgi:hypothetical protein
MSRPNRTSRSNAVLGLSAGVAMLRHALFTGSLLLLLVGLPVFCGLAWLHVRAQTTPNDREIIVTWAEACGWAEGLSLPDHVLHYELDGAMYQLDAGSFANAPQVIALRDVVWTRIEPRLKWIAVIAGLAALIVGYGLGQVGGRIRRDAFLRGGLIATPRQLRRLLRGDGPLSLLQVGPIRLSRESECQHLLIEGTPGTGKSVALDHLLFGVGRAWPMIVYDTKGEFSKRLLGDGDVVLNPLDERCPGWTPWNEIVIPTDAALIAKVLVAPPQAGQDGFWVERARGMLSDVLESTPPERRTNAELCRLLVVAGIDELKVLLAGTPTGRLFQEADAGKMRESISGTLVETVRGLRLLRPDAKGSEGFSITAWVRAAAECTDAAPRVFLACPPNHAPAIAPIIAAWLESAAAAMLGLVPSRTRRVLFAIDELPTLPPLDYLQRLAAEGRGHGACIVAAVQSLAQLRVRYGDHGAAAFCAQFSTHLLFRAADPDTAEHASQLLGEEEIDTASETEGAASKTNHSLSGDLRTRRLVTPTEMMQLRNLHCFLRVPGPFPITELVLKPRRARDVALAYVPRDPSTLLHRPAVAPPKPESKPKPPTVDDGGPL